MLRRTPVFCGLLILFICGIWQANRSWIALETREYYCSITKEGVSIEGDYDKSGYGAIVTIQNKNEYNVIVRQTRQTVRDRPSDLIDAFTLLSFSKRQLYIKANDLFEVMDERLIPITVIHVNWLRKIKEK